MINTKDRRGELTSQQIVMIVILIISFAAILIFFISLNLRSEIDAETCRNSVVLRGLPQGDSVELNCKTEEVCFSIDGEPCSQSVQDTENIEVKDKDELLDELTDLAYECWWQMGSGEIDYISSDERVRNNYCVICDELYFSNELQTEVQEITLVDYFTKLGEKKVPGEDRSLLFELYGINSIEELSVKYKEGTGSDVNDGLPINLPEGYMLVTGQTAPGWGGALIGGSAVSALGSLGVLTGIITGPVGWAVLGGAVIGGAVVGSLVASNVGGLGGFLVQGDSGEQYLSPSIYPFNSNALKELECNDFASLAS